MDLFKTIPQKRLLIYLMLAGLLPIILVIVFYAARQKELKDLENTLAMVQEKAIIKEKKQAQNIAVRNHYRDADHFYIDKYVESLIFLEPEIESLQKIMQQNNFAEDEKIKKRLEFLSHENNLAFSEGVVQSSPQFQEVIETQVHPVEVNVSDIQRVLSRIEGVDVGSYAPGPNRPQLIIVDFKLDKKKVTDKNEVYQLTLKLLKREFL